MINISFAQLEFSFSPHYTNNIELQDFVSKGMTQQLLNPGNRLRLHKNRANSVKYPLIHRSPVSLLARHLTSRRYCKGK